MALDRRAGARAGGGASTIIHDQDDALAGADAVYAKSWGPVKHYGQPEEERRWSTGSATGG